MEFRIMIVDDDKAIRRILAGIIENHSLGEIVGEACDGEEAEKKIITLNPDIVLMDLLLPAKDGIEVIKEVRNRGAGTHFIMISQVEDQDMITRAYESGIEFFIHKPINVTETINVISKVEEIIKLKATFQRIKETVAGAGVSDTGQVKKQEMTKVDFLLADLGILGEAGSEDIKVLIENYERVKKNTGNLQEIYHFLQEYYETTDRKKSSDLKAIEMRIRRAISKAMGNIASMGMEDYDSEQFLRYASILFEFKEVKKQMDFLRGKASEGGKINVKKFLEGIAFLCRT
ncbi:response regulator [Thermosediminibacter litoriperuensis]|uniref:Stage 0 sporulation protein A homolog n=1 Tax=Thermosediminibacter litoriperuensis TaxID=291989 RepID=A0A5S5AJV2_9FIRM|nr:response regulator [Thermosediminibacter litoriperuensis]TYP50897.1 two-component system response regulator YcbB [Thermosediminibacter litoriperuensis]